MQLRVFEADQRIASTVKVETNSKSLSHVFVSFWSSYLGLL